MADTPSDVETLAKSLASYNTYPQNLLSTDDFPHDLELYCEKLHDGANLFQPEKANLVLRDLVDVGTGGHIYHDEELKGTDKLQQLLSVDKPDPRRRYCFIQSTSSRDPLGCSHDQLAIVFSRHQVMAKFLDFVFTFKRRVDPHSYASFRCEDTLNPLDRVSEVKPLQRSGVHIQHCFNLLAMEPNEHDATVWRQRQVAAYHSFDLIEGNTFWTILKGNDVIQNRMQKATDRALASRPQFPNSVALSFQQTLREHLLLLQWSTENWIPYIESLEEQCRKITEITRFPHVQELADDVPLRQMIHRASTMDNRFPFLKPRRSWTATIKEQFGAASKWMTEKWPRDEQQESKSALTPRKPAPSAPPTQFEMSILKDKDLDLDKLATFEDLQDLNLVIEELLSAISIIDQNKRVFSDLRDRYIELSDSALFEMHLDGEDVYKQCRGAINDFVRQTRHMSGDLDNFQLRLRAILQMAEQDSEVYNYIFQVRNTRTAEYFASAAQDSADIMQVWTEQMHQKTLSMHLITIFTLIFLPGTFVAVRQTMFSSGIIVFGNEGDGGFGPNLGDWKLRSAGLKLFFAICLPLLTITLGVWLLAYMKSKVGQFLKSRPSESLPK
ncbi:hypothetical protein CC79DRAFT_1398254 [Sarocladium strictum]